MRLSVRLAATGFALAIAALPGAASAQFGNPPYPGPYPERSTANFSVPTEAFFTGTVSRATYFGCAILGPDVTALCLTSVFETGIERATGLGAARSLLTRVSGDPGAANFFFLPGYAGPGGGQLESSAVNLDPDPSPFPPPSGRYAAYFPLGGLMTPGEVVRRSVAGVGTQWETFAFPNEQIPMWFRLSYTRPPYYPGECSIGGSGFCTVDWLARPTLVGIQTSVLPEPSTYALLGTGLLTLGGIAARRRRSA